MLKIEQRTKKGTHFDGGRGLFCDVCVPVQIVCVQCSFRAGFLMVMHLFSVILLQFFSRPCNGLSMHIFAYTSSSSFWVKA